MMDSVRRGMSNEHHEPEPGPREREARSRSSLEGGSDGVILAIPGGRILTANRAACQMLGYAEEELRRLGFQALADLTDPTWIQALEERGQTGCGTAALTFVRKDGSRLVAEATSSVFRDERGALRSCTILRDLTAARRARRPLDLQEARFRRLVEAVPEGLWVTDDLGMTGYVNRRAAELLGYAPEEMNLRSLFEFVADDAEIAELGPLLTRREGGWVKVGDCRLRRKDGAELWASMNTTPLLDEAGEFLGALTTISDITERKHVEESMRFLSEASKDMLSSLDHAARLERLAEVMVPRLADICAIDLVEGSGVRRAVVRHQAPAKADVIAELCLHPPGPSRPAGVQRVLRTGTPELCADVTDAWLREVAGADEDYFHVTRRIAARSIMIVPLLFEGRTVGAISLASLGRRYERADLALVQALAEWAALALDHARLYQEALRAVQMRDEVLGIVSHDLRNPIGNIHLSAKLLETAPLDPGARRHVERIQRGVARANHLIQDLLEVSRGDAGKLSLDRAPHDVAGLIDEAVDLQRAAAEQKGICIDLDLSPDLPPIDADRHRLLQVAANLLDNALKHTPEGGRIRVAAALEGGAVRFSVEDSGPGIAPEDRPHVFDRFWQAKTQRRAGAGLGLAIAKATVEAHGGTIWVESEVGHGAAFRFTCPVSAGSPVAS
jgi:PAS domain S-box-containing protein